MYSTSPELAMGEDGRTYFIKGRNEPTAFTEVAGCRLALAAGLQVPSAHIGIYGEDRYAAVEAVPGAQRTIQPWLKHMERLRNRPHLYEVITVDTWLVNDDRNMGNLVGGNPKDGFIDLYMIDFEKSRSLHPNPFMGSGSVEPRRLWPTAELGQILLRGRPATRPTEVLNRVRALSKDQIDELLQEVAEDFPLATWYESSAELLYRRAQELDRLVEVVWQAT